MRKYFVLLYFFLFVFSVLFISGCSGSGSQERSFFYDGSTATGSVSGVVTDYFSGLGVSGATVTIGGVSALTAEDGSYTISGLSAGFYDVTITMVGYYAFSGVVEVVQGETTLFSAQIRAYDVVLLTDPVDGATGVPLDTVISITFNHNITPGAGYNNIAISDGVGNISYTSEITGAILKLRPESLSLNKTYTVTIPADAVDGIRGMASDFVFSFTTRDRLWGIATTIESGVGDAVYPQVAMDASGNAIAVWEQSDGSVRNIYANRYE